MLMKPAVKRQDRVGRLRRIVWSCTPVLRHSKSHQHEQERHDKGCVVRHGAASYSPFERVATLPLQAWLALQGQIVHPRFMDSSAWKPTACILCECNCGLEVQLG